MEEEKNEVDRISKLPDDLLSHILSFLDFKEAMATSVLSKRWEKVWTWRHTLRLYNRSCVKGITIFTYLVNRVLIGRHCPVTSFCFDYYFPMKKSDEEQKQNCLNVSRWLDSVVSRSLEEFDFTLKFGEPCFMERNIQIPSSLFTCQNLVTLKLSSRKLCSSVGSLIWLDHNLPVTATINLPSLKQLHLSCVGFVHHNSLKTVLSGCPVLEELFIFYVLFHECSIIDICSASLKILKVCECRHQKNTYDVDTSVYYVVETPKLEYLYFKERFCLGISMKAPPSLVEAAIHLSIPACYLFGPPIPSFMRELFKVISSVTKLELSSDEISEDVLANLPNFHNLTQLRLGSWHAPCILTYFLQRSPSLKHFILDSYVGDAFPISCVSECVLSNLDIIEIRERKARDAVKISEIIRWKQDDGKIIQYFLENGKVQNKKNIHHYHLSPEKKKELLKEIAPRIFGHKRWDTPPYCKLCSI